jgi:hypothetical protein
MKVNVKVAELRVSLEAKFFSIKLTRKHKFSWRKVYVKLLLDDLLSFCVEEETQKLSNRMSVDGLVAGLEGALLSINLSRYHRPLANIMVKSKCNNLMLRFQTLKSISIKLYKP